MAKRYWYQCVYECDVAYYGPDQRRERFLRRGRSEISVPTMHSIRVYPSRGYNARGEEISADYIVTDAPLGKNYTEEITKRVSRPDFEHPGKRERVMREKVSKVKFMLVDPGDIQEAAKRAAYDYGPPEYTTNAKGQQVQVGGWHHVMFETHDEDVVLPGETAKMAEAGAKEVAKMRKGA